VTKNEKDYSDYVDQLLNLTNGLHFFAGFIFTSITILLTQHPEPSQMHAQVTLLFLAVLFYLFVFLALYAWAEVTYFMKNIPPLSKRRTAFNLAILLVLSMSGVAIILMFLLWNLVYLALASGVVWVSYVISVLVFIVKPFQVYREKVS